MSRSFVLSGNIEPSRTESAYILALALTYGNGLAAITSANELLIADRQKLNNDPIRFQQDVPSGTSCLISAQDNGQTILCSGTDGSVAMFDIRTQSKVSGFQIGNTAFTVRSSIDLDTDRCRSSGHCSSC